MSAKKAMQTEYARILQVLSNVLMLPLRVSLHEDKPRVRVPLDETLTYTTGSCNVPMSVQIHGYNIEPKQGWVLAKLRKRVWILVFCDLSKNELSLAVVDADTLNIKEVNADQWNAFSVDKLLTVLAPGIRATFIKGIASAKWNCLNEKISTAVLVDAG